MKIGPLEISRRGAQLRVPRRRHVQREAAASASSSASARRPATPSSGRRSCRSGSTRSASSGPTSRPTRRTSSSRCPRASPGSRGSRASSSPARSEGIRIQPSLLARRQVPDRRHRRVRRHRQGQAVRRRARRRAGRRHPQARHELQHHRDVRHHHAGGAARLLPRPRGRLLDGRHGGLHDPPRPVRARPAAGVHQRRGARRHPARAEHRPDDQRLLAGVEFFKTLPSIDDPIALRGPDFQLPTQITSPTVADVAAGAGGATGEDAARQPGAERLRRRVHLADDDHRLGEDLLDLHIAGGLQRPGDRQDLDRRQVPDHRQAELRRRPDLDQRPALRRPLEDQLGQRHRPLPRRHPRPGPAPDALRQAEDGLHERLGRGSDVRRRRRPDGAGRGLDGADRGPRRPRGERRLCRHQRRDRRRGEPDRRRPRRTTSTSSTRRRPARRSTTRRSSTRTRTSRSPARGSAAGR